MWWVCGGVFQSCRAEVWTSTIWNTVLGIRDILVRIRILGPYLWLTNPDADPGGPKTNGSYGSGCVFGKLVHLHHSSKIKSHKEVTKQYKPRVFLLFLLDGGRILSRIRSRIRYCNWRIRCGSGRPKNIRIWIRVLIRILNTADSLPAHVPTPKTKGTFERRGDLKKRHTTGPRPFCREL